MTKAEGPFLPLRLLCDANAKYGPGPAKRDGKVCLQRLPKRKVSTSPVPSNMPLSTSVEKTRNSESDRLAITLNSLISSFGDFDFLIFSMVPYKN